MRRAFRAFRVCRVILGLLVRLVPLAYRGILAKLDQPDQRVL